MDRVKHCGPYRRCRRSVHEGCVAKPDAIDVIVLDRTRVPDWRGDNRTISANRKSLLDDVAGIEMNALLLQDTL
jgi:hypothetical protein